MAQAYGDTAQKTPEAAPLIADPAPLGLAGFGFTTLMFGLVKTGILGSGAPGVSAGVLSLALTFGGLAQLLAGMWAFKRGNTFAATAFTAYGAFWFSFFLLVNVFIPQMIAGKATTSDVTTFVATYELAWGIFTAYMFIASLAGARAVQLVFILLAVTFIVLAIGDYAVSTDIGKFGGWVALATAAAAIYASFADVTNANFKRKVLPT
jgi:succinate-acetate transporter protein